MGYSLNKEILMVEYFKTFTKKDYVMNNCPHLGSRNALMSHGAVSERSVILYYIFERLLEFFDKDYFTFLELYTRDLKVKSQTTLSNLNHYLHYKENAIIPSTLTLLILIQNTSELHLISDFVCLMSKYSQKLHRFHKNVSINI